MARTATAKEKKTCEAFNEFDGCRIPEFAMNAERKRRLQEEAERAKKAKKQKRLMIASIVISLTCLALNCCLFYSMKILVSTIINMV